MPDFASILTNALAATGAAAPGVQQAKARLGVVAHDGYAALDTYRAAQPFLFVAGLLGMGVSIYALTKRRHVGEAWALYVTTAIGSAGLAWVTRPGTAVAAVAAQTAPGAPPGGLMAMLDGRAASLATHDPQFSQRALGRLLTDLGTDKISPALRTLIAS